MGNDKDWSKIYNDWRDLYEEWSYKDHQAFYNEIERDWPSQVQCDLGYFAPFLVKAIEIPEIRVLELGGWKGDIAQLLLASPLGKRIKSWANYDICPAILDKQVCKDPRYHVRVPDNWFWETTIPDDYDLFFCSHTVEHLSRDHVKELLSKLDSLRSLRYIYLETPLPLSCTNNQWKDYRGSHKLQIGWVQLRTLIEAHKWIPLYLATIPGTFGAIRLDPPGIS
ncbi:MAG: hypothetical protein JSW41_03845 [Candidatus Aenigmatarchaeota archaeon]|nr:MAG: hypothetical protein JSW41_03845 [Candidatus Aenigmarchaeota archaeon]